jgi:hypothetical protein
VYRLRAGGKPQRGVRAEPAHKGTTDALAGFKESGHCGDTALRDAEYPAIQPARGPPLALLRPGDCALN